MKIRVVRRIRQSKRCKNAVKFFSAVAKVYLLKCAIVKVAMFCMQLPYYSLYRRHKKYANDMDIECTCYRLFKNTGIIQWKN